MTIWGRRGNTSAVPFIHQTALGPELFGQRDLELHTARGVVQCRYRPVCGAKAGVLWLSGTVNGFHSPARGLYPRLAHELAGLGISSLHVKYRHSTKLDEACFDALAAAAHAMAHGAQRLALVGHSFGAAVAIQVAVAIQSACGLVGLASQSAGALPARDLDGRCPLLLLHGDRDELLRPKCSEYIGRLAGAPCRFELLKGGGHDLDEVADAVYEATRLFLLQRLGHESGQELR